MIRSALNICAAPLRRATALLDRGDRALGLGDRAREAGGATVEFVILLPVFLLVFMSSVEASLLLTRQVMLERAVDLAVRDIRLGGGAVTQTALRDEVCDRALILADCQANLLVELTEISRSTYAVPSSAQPCVNRSTSITPTPGWATAGPGKMILLRACFAVDPILPGVGLGTQLVSNLDGDSVRMVASTAFVVEPD